MSIMLDENGRKRSFARSKTEVVETPVEKVDFVPVSKAATKSKKDHSKRGLKVLGEDVLKRFMQICRYERIASFDEKMGVTLPVMYKDLVKYFFKNDVVKVLNEYYIQYRTTFEKSFNMSSSEQVFNHFEKLRSTDIIYNSILRKISLLLKVLEIGPELLDDDNRVYTQLSLFTNTQKLIKHIFDVENAKYDNNWLIDELNQNSLKDDIIAGKLTLQTIFKNKKTIIILDHLRSRNYILVLGKYKLGKLEKVYKNCYIRYDVAKDKIVIDQNIPYIPEWNRVISSEYSNLSLFENKQLSFIIDALVKGW